MFMAPKKKTRTMSPEHKAALAEGRDEGRKVRYYLEALNANKPKRGRKRTADSMRKRLAAIEQELPSAKALNKVNLIQERIDLSDALAAGEQSMDLSELEKDFIEVAAGYSQRKGITYAAWRQSGVDAAVLKKAGISRSGR